MSEEARKERINGQFCELITMSVLSPASRFIFIGKFVISNLLMCTKLGQRDGISCIKNDGLLSDMFVFYKTRN